MFDNILVMWLTLWGSGTCNCSYIILYQELIAAQTTDFKDDFNYFFREGRTNETQDLKGPSRNRHTLPLGTRKTE